MVWAKFVDSAVICFCTGEGGAYSCVVSCRVMTFPVLKIKTYHNITLYCACRAAWKASKYKSCHGENVWKKEWSKGGTEARMQCIARNFAEYIRVCFDFFFELPSFLRVVCPLGNDV